MEQYEVLHEIVAADKRARAAFEQAQRQNSHFDGALRQQRQAYEEQAYAEAREEIERTRTAALAQAETALAEANARYDRELAALQERFAGEREACAEKMFRITVGLE